MGFLDYIGKRRERPSLGVCIPEVRQQSAQKPVPQDGVPRFRITGVYAVRKDVSLLGTVASGRIRAGSKLVESGKPGIKVSALFSSNKSVKELERGEHGVVHLNTANDLGLKAGEVVEFE